MNHTKSPCDLQGMIGLPAAYEKAIRQLTASLFRGLWGFVSLFVVERVAAFSVYERHFEGKAFAGVLVLFEFVKPLTLNPKP